MSDHPAESGQRERSSDEEAGTRYLIRLSYDGTNYYGWQKQKDRPTVQQEIEKGVKQLFQQNISVLGSSRTDSGVHALGQVASFSADKFRPEDRVKMALNDVLPDDISVHHAQTVESKFHPIQDARSKTYLYVILNRREPPALFRRYVNWIPSELDFESMESAAKLFAGEKNYLAFATDSDTVDDPFCRIEKIELTRKAGYTVLLVRGNRFLYNMVRTIAGSLIEIGKGNKDSKWIQSLFEKKDRREAGPVAAASGLYLYRIHFSDEIQNDDLTSMRPTVLFLPEMLIS